MVVVVAAAGVLLLPEESKRRRTKRKRGGWVRDTAGFQVSHLILSLSRILLVVEDPQL
jgi:hypothetical protein